MIKFFRNIRRRLLRENRFTRYLIYAIGEIILVVIGILIALQINNWNEDHKENHLEDKMLKEILVELETSIQSLQNDIRINTEIRDTINFITRQIKSDRLNDSLIPALSFIPEATVIGLNTSSYDNLKNLGFTIIRNDSLRKLITDLYENGYGFARAEEKRDNNLTYNYFSPRYLEYFKSIEASNTSPFENTLIPKNYEVLKEPEFLKLINYYKTRKVRLLYTLRYTIEPMIALKKQLIVYTNSEVKA